MSRMGWFRNGFKCFKAGGNTCYSITGENRFHAVPSGAPNLIVHPYDTGPALVALGAKFRLMGPSGERTLDATEFFTLPKASPAKYNALAEGELLAGVEFPEAKLGTRSAKLLTGERVTPELASRVAEAAVDRANPLAKNKTQGVADSAISPAAPKRMGRRSPGCHGCRVRQTRLQTVLRNSLTQIRRRGVVERSDDTAELRGEITSVTGQAVPAACADPVGKSALDESNAAGRDCRTSGRRCVVYDTAPGFMEGESIAVMVAEKSKPGGFRLPCTLRVAVCAPV
jgi:hypothetical protein